MGLGTLFCLLLGFKYGPKVLVKVNHTGSISLHHPLYNPSFHFIFRFLRNPCRPQRRRNVIHQRPNQDDSHAVAEPAEVQDTTLHQKLDRLVRSAVFAEARLEWMESHVLQTSQEKQAPGTRNGSASSNLWPDTLNWS